MIGSLYDNNLGCIQMMQQKPNLAHFYFSEAIKEHLTAIKEIKAWNRIDVSLQVSQC